MFMMFNEKESLLHRCLIAVAPFGFLAVSNYFILQKIRFHCLFVPLEYGFEAFACFSVDHRLYFNEEQLIYYLYAFPVVCLCSSRRMKKLSWS